MGRSQQLSRWTALALGGVLSACGDSTGPIPTPPCNTSAGQNLTPLAVGEYVALAPLANAGCLIFPGNSSASNAEYLVVPQIATAIEGAKAAFVLDGDTLHAVLSAQVAAPETQPAGGAGLNVGDRFHDFLRAQERLGFTALPPAPTTAAPVVSPPRVPPTVGDVRTFSVCAKTDCSGFQIVTATAKTVSGHLAIYVDNSAPSGGLTQAELDSLAGVFDTTLYAVDTTAFGRESDIDGNGVVVVLMTNVVNRLVTKQVCDTGFFVAGFFYGFDIDPKYAKDARSNHGEVFYSIVADPSGTLSCAHDARQVKRLVPITFVHEFQHMISYNQHVLVRHGALQETWLDEGLSHLAEELGGRSFLPGDSATFSNFVISDLYNAYQYLDSSGAHYLAFSSGIGSLPERGAAWLFVRYITDQFRTDASFAATAAFTRQLVETSLVGAADVENATGTPFATLDERWALANYVSDLDLPGFTAPPELRYTSWPFRATYASLNSQRPTVFRKSFPLTPPASAGSGVSLSGTLKAGSAVYARVLQGPLVPGFTLLFSGPGGAALPANLAPRLSVIRIH